MILTDTGFWIALINKKDRHHKRANAVLQELDSPLITTWPVLTETTHLLLSRLGANAQSRFIDNLAKGHIEIFQLTTDHLGRIKSLVKKYEALPMDLADASLVILAESIGHGNILSTDQRDFRTYRWKNRHPFNNILLPN